MMDDKGFFINTADIFIMWKFLKRVGNGTRKPQNIHWQFRRAYSSQIHISKPDTKIYNGIAGMGYGVDRKQDERIRRKTHHYKAEGYKRTTGTIGMAL